MFKIELIDSNLQKQINQSNPVIVEKILEAKMESCRAIHATKHRDHIAQTGVTRL